jgi:hypothetical protein
MAFKATFNHPEGRTPENPTNGATFDKIDVEVKVLDGIVQKQDTEWFVLGKIGVFIKGILFWQTNVKLNDFTHDKPLYPQIYAQAKTLTLEFKFPNKESVIIPYFEDIENN